MRYYNIVITNPNGAQVNWTSQVNGQNDPGALDINFDIVETVASIPSGNSRLQIVGVSLQDIAQAKNYNPIPSKSPHTPPTYSTLALYGGLYPGLPLASAAFKAGQSGLLTQGNIFQAFGNWIDTDQTLDFGWSPGTGTNNNPANIAQLWQKGTPLETAIKASLSAGFPGYTVVTAISQNLTLNYDQSWLYNTLEQFATFISDISQKILGGIANYQGVQIAVKGKTITVFDGTGTQPSAKVLQFQDLIGQPTWIDLLAIQFKCPIRADIHPGDTVTLPLALTTVTAQSSPQFRQSSAFQGTFRVQRVRHVGNFRQSDAYSWTSTYDAIVVPAQSQSSNPTQLGALF